MAKKEKEEVNKKNKSVKTKEKPLNSKQKLALERINRLIELAEPNGEYAKKYIWLAKRISEKYRARIPKELKQKYCKKCFSVNVELSENASFVVSKCLECGYQKKWGKRQKEKK